MSSHRQVHIPNYPQLFVEVVLAEFVQKDNGSCPIGFVGWLQKEFSRLAVEGTKVALSALRVSYLN